MTEAHSLTTDELSLLARAAILAGATVALSAHSGGGTRKEFEAIIRSLEASADAHPTNSLIQALLTPAARAEVTDLADQYKAIPTQTAYQDLKRAALNRLYDASEALKKAAPQDAAEVKQVILDMCQRVAEQSTEGGFLGFGGVKVDAREAAVIREIRRALGADA